MEIRTCQINKLVDIHTCFITPPPIQYLRIYLKIVVHPEGDSIRCLLFDIKGADSGTGLTVASLCPCSDGSACLITCSFVFVAVLFLPQHIPASTMQKYALSPAA